VATVTDKVKETGLRVSRLAGHNRPPGHPESKTLYEKRSAIIEPVFAQLFNRLGRQLNYGGTRTSLELHLWAADARISSSMAELIAAYSPPMPALVMNRNRKNYQAENDGAVSAVAAR
jgi:hypothetical protein